LIVERASRNRREMRRAPLLASRAIMGYLSGMFLLCFVFSGFLWANQEWDSIFHQLQSQKMSLATEDEKIDRYPVWVRWFLSEKLQFLPDFEDDAETSDCLAKNLKIEKNFVAFTESTAQYLKKCEPKIRSGWNDILSNTYRTMMLKLDPDHLPKARYVFFHLPGNTRLKGLLALKGIEKKRPLVILRLGIFSNVTEFLPERYLYYQLFEQSDFNLLILESNSSQEFIHRNKAVAFGGFDEGIQNFQVAKIVHDKKEPLSSYIDSIHLTGVSFGGHGVMYASLLNDLNLMKGKPVIASSLVMCPLVNYRETFNSHADSSLVSRIIEYWTAFRMKNIDKDLPYFAHGSFLENALRYGDEKYQGPGAWDESIRLPTSAQQKNKYWQANDFWSDYKHIKTPVLILATEWDPIVPFALNSQRIEKGLMDLTSSNVKVFSFPKGIHCSFPGAYKWKPMKTLVENYFLSTRAEM
jgi:hypothetical protein